MISVLTILFGICLLGIFKDISHLNTLVVFVIILFTIAFFFDITNNKKYRKYIIPLTLGYFLRTALLFYDVYSGDPFNLPLVGGALSSDPLRFYNTAIMFSQGQPTRYGGFFPRVLGCLFAVTGASRLLAEFIVLLFSIATIVVFITIIDDLNVEDSNGKKGAYLLCLLPNYAFLSVVLRRETIITFFVALSLLYFLRWIKGTGGVKAFVIAVVFVLGAALFHGATGLIIAGYIFIMMIYNPQKKKYMLETKNIVLAAAFIVLIVFIYSRYGTVFFEKLERRFEAETLSSTRDAGGSSYARFVGDASTPLRTIIYAVPRFMYYMFSPFPWQWRGINDVFTFLMSSCVYLWIIIRSIRSIFRSSKQDNKAIMISLLLIALVISAAFSWGVTNTGTATRHRDKLIVFFIVLFVLSGKQASPIKEIESNQRQNQGS